MGVQNEMGCGYRCKSSSLSQRAASRLKASRTGGSGHVAALVAVTPLFMASESLFQAWNVIYD